MDSAFGVKSKNSLPGPRLAPDPKDSLLQFSYNFSSNKTLTLSSILLSLLLLNMLFIERPDGGILLKPSEK